MITLKQLIQELAALDPDSTSEVQVFVRNEAGGYMLALGDDEMAPVCVNGNVIQLNAEKIPARDRCPRCGIGHDTNGDGDCAICARKTPEQVKQLRNPPQDVEDVIRAKGLFDGAVSLEEMSERLEREASRIRKLALDGRQLQEPVADDYAFLARSTGPSGGVYRWTVSIEVSPNWVADGFDLTQDRLHRMVLKDLEYAHPDDVAVAVLAAPDKNQIRSEQGYGSARLALICPDCESYPCDCRKLCPKCGTDMFEVVREEATGKLGWDCPWCGHSEDANE